MSRAANANEEAKARPGREGMRVLLATLGLILWSSCFVVLYGGLSVGCEIGLHRARWGGIDLLTLALTVAAALHLAAFAWLFLRHRRDLRRTRDEGSDDGGEGGEGPGRFMARMALAITVIGAISTVWISVPVLFLPPCL